MKTWNSGLGTAVESRLSPSPEPAQQELGIPRQIDRWKSLLEAQDKTISELMSRLEPIRRKTPMLPVSETKGPMPVENGLMGIMSDMAEQLDDNTSRIQILLNELEI